MKIPIYSTVPNIRAKIKECLDPRHFKDCVFITEPYARTEAKPPCVIIYYDAPFDEFLDTKPDMLVCSAISPQNTVEQLNRFFHKILPLPDVPQPEDGWI
jgi:hypothetical protein